MGLGVGVGPLRVFRVLRGGVFSDVAPAKPTNFEKAQSARQSVRHSVSQ